MRNSLPWMLTNQEKIDLKFDELSKSTQIETEQSLKVISDETKQKIIQVSGSTLEAVRNLYLKSSTAIKVKIGEFKRSSDQRSAAKLEAARAEAARAEAARAEAARAEAARAEAARAEEIKVNHSSELEKNYAPLAHVAEEIISFPAEIALVDNLPVLDRNPEQKSKKERKPYALLKLASVIMIIASLLSIGILAFDRFGSTSSEDAIAKKAPVKKVQDMGAESPALACPETSKDFSALDAATKICQSTRDFRPNISDAEITSIFSAINQSFSQCVKVRRAAPSNCPNRDVNKGVVSIRWSAAGSPKPMFTAQDEDFIYADVVFAVSSNGIKLAKGKRVKFVESYGDISKVKISKTQNNYQVIWD